jgi:hypothetical protein
VFEKNASIYIENDGNAQYALHETGDGIYQSEALDLPVKDKYRLRITTAAGKVYLSEYTQPIQTPPIDSVSWTWSPAGVGIFVTTHDPENKTTYYQWQVEEVWEILSDYKTFFRFDKGNFMHRPASETEAMFRCWKYSATQDLFVFSTATLTTDAVLQKPLLFIVETDDRLSQKYSVLVKQHALSKKEFEYIQLIKKNTDQVGSFSDPQPSELFGNISSIDSPDEPVVGYVGSYSSSEQRIYIYPYQLPDWNFDISCFEKEVDNQPDSIQKYYVSRKLVPTVGATFQIPSPMPITYYASPASCVDCRLRGGINIKPEFW